MEAPVVGSRLSAENAICLDRKKKRSAPKSKLNKVHDWDLPARYFLEY